jgi:KipI family sensor histidine kinase inhibitor
MHEERLYMPAGDRALVVELGDTIRPEINRSIRELMLAIESADIFGVSELVPTYRSLLVYYEPQVTSFEELKRSIELTEQSSESVGQAASRIVHFPTLYGGEHGPDIEFVAENAGLTTQSVIETHSGTDYLVYMMGFSPGFPYLGGLSENLATPRLASPRVEIPAGSVGIAESQTGVYPAASPGGWQLIGRTPLKMFDPNGDPPALLSAGDYIRFIPLGSEAEFQDIQQRVSRGEYEVAIEVAP